MLTIFQFFAAKTEASVLRMLEGSPYEYLHKPIIEYLEARGAKIYTRRRVREILFTEAGTQTKVTGLVIANGETEEPSPPMPMSVPVMSLVCNASYRKHGASGRSLTISTSWMQCQSQPCSYGLMVG
jgi:myosin-crossreactive antigen